MNRLESHVYSHANPFFVDAVRARGGNPVVLDVGCWDGALGAVLIRELGAIVDGVELSGERAATAVHAGYRHVEIVDLDVTLPELGSRTYDFVLFGDVLEHLKHPEQVLAELSMRLRPGGRVLVSLPNIAFVANRLSHLAGNWEYRDYGILDRTHLHFYTRRTMVQLLEQAGLRVLRVQGYVGLHRHPWLVREPMRWLGKQWPSLFAIQIVLESDRCSSRADA